VNCFAEGAKPFLPVTPGRELGRRESKKSLSYEGRENDRTDVHGQRPLEKPKSRRGKKKTARGVITQHWCLRRALDGQEGVVARLRTSFGLFTF